MYDLPKEPVGIGPVLDGGIQLYLSAFKTLFPLIALLLVVSVVSTASMPVSDQGALFPSTSIVLVSLVSALAGWLISIALIYKIWTYANNDVMSTQDALSLALPKLIPVIVWIVVYGLIVAFGTILFIIPGLILGVNYILGQYVIVLEGTGPIESLGRSRELVRGNWWRVAVIVTVYVLLMTGLVLAAAIVGALSSPAETSLINSVSVLSWASTGLTPFLTPLAMSITIVLYHDLRLRHEGTDLGSAIDNL